MIDPIIHVDGKVVKLSEIDLLFAEKRAQGSNIASLIFALSQQYREALEMLEIFADGDMGYLEELEAKMKAHAILDRARGGE